MLTGCVWARHVSEAHVSPCAAFISHTHTHKHTLTPCVWLTQSVGGGSLSAVLSTLRTSFSHLLLLLLFMLPLSPLLTLCLTPKRWQSVVGSAKHLWGLHGRTARVKWVKLKALNTRQTRREWRLTRFSGAGTWCRPEDTLLLKAAGPGFTLQGFSSLSPEQEGR